MIQLMKRHLRIDLSDIRKFAAVLVVTLGFALAVPGVAYAGSPVPITEDCPRGQCIIDKYVNPAIAVATALVGIAVAISLVIAGIEYSTGSDNAQKVASAKHRIVITIFVFVGFLVFRAFLGWVIPGEVGGV